MTTATLAPITKRGTIRSRHPLRETFSGCSDYYDTKGAAVHAYESALADWGLCFNCDQLMDMPGDNGRITVEVWTDSPEDGDCVGYALLMWHRMDYSGRWEFVGYLT